MVLTSPRRQLASKLWTVECSAKVQLPPDHTMSEPGTSLELLGQSKRRVGILTPASNTTVEPTTGAMLSSLPGVSAHFSRFSLPGSLRTPITAVDLLPAASLLREAEVELVVFHGTAGSITGIADDRALCCQLESELGIPATTATQALLDAFRELDVRSYALVLPGPADIAREIIEQYAAEGFECRLTVAGDLGGNLITGRMSQEGVRTLVEPAFEADVDAVVVVSTNLAAAPLVEELEQRFGTTVIDSLAATTWQFLRLIGESEPLTGWGKLLARSR